MRRVGPRRGGRGGGARRGFTLVETLVAFAVVAVGLGTLLAGLGSALRADAKAAATRRAVRTAQALLAEAGVARPLADARGETADGLAWEMAVTAVALPPPARGAPPPPGAALAWVAVAVRAPGGVEVGLGAVKRAEAAGPRP